MFANGIDQDRYFRIFSDKYNLFLSNVYSRIKNILYGNVKYKNNDTRFFGNPRFVPISQRNMLYFI